VTVRVGLVVGTGAESEAALAWLTGLGDVQVRRYEPGHLEAAVNEADVVWIHGEARPALLPTEAVRGFVGQGGGLLLTLQAAALVGPLGFETVPPNDRQDMVWSHQRDEWWSEDMRALPSYPHLRGLATYGPHVLVEGLHHGTYCWAPAEGEPFAWACYSGGAWPADGRVVAVERGYRIQNPERLVAWEYAIGRGRVLCIGAFTYLAAPDPQLRPQLERLLLNAINACAGTAAGPRTWWPSPGTVASPSEALALPDPIEFDGAFPLPSDDVIMIRGPVQRDEPFDLAGRRALLVGGEQQGIREVWIHPHRAVATWVVKADGEAALGAQVEVTPDLVSRALQTADRRLIETALVALEHPVVLVEYRPGRKRRESVGRGPVDFEIELTIDLRRTWPFAAGCGGNLAYRSRSDGRVAVVASESDDGVVAVFLSRGATVEMVPGAGDAPAVRCRIGTTLGSPLFVAIVGGVSQAEFQRTLRGIRRLGIAGLVRQRTQRAAVVADARLTVRSDDALFDCAFAWAKRRLDAFLGDVPGLGRSLMAGYAPTRSGVDDGRPGAAWFFGRDACWTSLALLAAGEHSVVRQVVRFLGDRQDVTGKVLDEATASGQFSFDAADATPLFLLLVVRYLQWSGDREFVASIWPHVERAYAFCLSTDTDGDGLIEHPRAGHAIGTATRDPRLSLYLAALWQAALGGLAKAAEVLGQDRLAAECWARAARATAAIEDKFYDATRGSYALEIRSDGTQVWTQSAVHAVPLLLGSANPIRAKSLLEALGGEAFNAAWGVRMLPVTDPHFSPTARETGAVWPLLTGWASLAEYRAGLGPAGFQHLKTNADLAYRRQKGAFDEALHALEERALEGCPDRACSAGMVVLPLVEGLLGVDPDAAAGRITIAPQLPEAWTRLDVRGLRCADSAYDLRLQRLDGALAATCRRTLGPGLQMTLAPWLPTLPSRVEVDGREVRAEVSGWGAGLRCAVTLEPAAQHEVLYVLK
jgi:hypothetical protein